VLPFPSTWEARNRGTGRSARRPFLVQTKSFARDSSRSSSSSRAKSGRLATERPEHLVVIALSLRRPQRLLGPGDDDTAPVNVSGRAPDTDAFSGVSGPPDEPERHVPSPSPPAKNQTGQTRRPDLFAARPGLDRTKHVGRRQLQTGRTAYGQRATGERKLCRLAPMGREPFGVRGRPSDAGPSDGAPTALAPV
jgi:hypothetical protein